MSDFRNTLIEGGMEQAVEFLVRIGSTKHTNRIGARAGSTFLLAGSCYANTIIDGLMGYKPSVNSDLKPFMADSNRYFEGKITNVRFGKRAYIFETNSNGVKMTLSS